MTWGLDPSFLDALDALGRVVEASKAQVSEEPHTYVRHNARGTSAAAAAAALPKSGTRRRQVYDFIWDQGIHGATDDEIILGLGIGHQSVGPRRLELVEQGHIEDSGERRLTIGGNPAIVWKAAT